jgi:hypothetical protein
MTRAEGKNSRPPETRLGLETNPILPGEEATAIISIDEGNDAS